MNSLNKVESGLFGWVVPHREGVPTFGKGHLVSTSFPTALRRGEVDVTLHVVAQSNDVVTVESAVNEDDSSAFAPACEYQTASAREYEKVFHAHLWLLLFYPVRRGIIL